MSLKKPDREFSSTRVDIDGAVADKMTKLAKEIPDRDLAEDGREMEPHVTVKFGLHDAKATDALKRALSGFGPIQAKLGSTSLFENPEFDVVKCDVASHDLHRLNKLISRTVKATDTHPDYTPHATIAYVKKGIGKKYSGDVRLKGTPLTFTAVTFSAKDRSTESIPLGKYSIR